MVIERGKIDCQLDKILASPEFVRSERMARFLRFVVRLSLELRSSELKERSIGIEVFDRPPDWDPKLDTIVRSEARRLRNKLETYYATSGLNDAVRISIPKGGYAPEIEFIGEAEPKEEITPLPVPGKARNWLTVFLPVAVSGLIACLAWLWVRDREIRVARADSFEIVPFATEFGTEIGPSISPDGKTVAYSWDGNGSNFDIYIQQVDRKRTGQNTRVRFTESPKPEVYPKWSPNGREIAFLRGDVESTAVVIKPMDGTGERVATHIERRGSGWLGDYVPLADVGPAWTPDGKSLIVEDAAPAGRHGLFLIDVSTGSRRQVTSTERAVADFIPRVSPDGKRVAFVRYFSHGLSDVFVSPLSEDRPKQLTFDRRAITGLAWTPDGKSLVFASWRHGSARLWQVDAAGDTAPRRILSDGGSVADIAISPSGDWMAYAAISENWNIWRVPLTQSPHGSTAGPPERFLSSSGRNHGPSFSPDGRHLGFISDRSGAWEIWLGDSDGSHMTQVTHFNGPFLGSITWTPDSKTIAFDARPGGNANIFLLDVTGGEPRPLAASAFEERMPRFSRDGKAVYFNSDRDGTVKVWRQTLAGNHAMPVGVSTSFASYESWDGRQLYFNVPGAGIWIARPDGTGAHELPGISSEPEINWIPGPNSLYFTRQQRTGGSEFCEFIDGRIRVLLTIPGQLVLNTSNLAVSPDGKWLLYAQQDHFTSDIDLRRGSIVR
jgi:Tol biopolymer transport system component